MENYKVVMHQLSTSKNDDGKKELKLLNLDWSYAEYIDALNKYKEMSSEYALHVGSIEYTQINMTLFLISQSNIVLQSVNLSNNSKI